MARTDTKKVANKVQSDDEGAGGSKRATKVIFDADTGSKFSIHLGKEGSERS